MAGPVGLLNLDNSYPNDDPFRSSNAAGIVRYVSAADPGGIPVMNRLQGDLVHRDKLLQSKLNELILLLNSNPILTSFDDSMYMFKDGSRAFTAPVAGAYPVGNNDLTTKAYVQAVASNLGDLITTLNANVSDLASLVPFYCRSNWIEHTWEAGEKGYLDLPLTVPVSILDRVMSISLVEKIDVAQSTPSVPDPDPIWKYRPLAVGPSSNAGITIDDVWLEDQNTVRVLIPNTAGAVSGYPPEADYVLASPRQRFIRALVWEYRVESPTYAYIAPSYSLNSDFITFAASGEMFTGLTFGYWIPNRNIELQSVQISAMETPIGSDITVEILKNGVAISGSSFTLPAGQGTANFTFTDPGPVVAVGSQIRMRVTGIGSSSPGGYLSCNLVYQGV